MSAPPTTYNVTVWPRDGEAAQWLARYIDERAAGEIVSLGGSTLDFSGADLRRFNLTDAQLHAATLEEVNLSGADLFGAALHGAKLNGADLSGAYLAKAEAPGCDAVAASFAGAVLFRVDFTEADLRRADLRDTNLNSARFYRADLRDANLRGCRFGPTPTQLEQAKLAGMDVTDASGDVLGPAYVADDQILDGAELQQWFTAHGAPEVRVVVRPISR